MSNGQFWNLFVKPEYVEDDVWPGKKKWILPPSGKETLVAFLSSRFWFTHGSTLYQSMAGKYNDDMGCSGVYPERELPNSLSMPNYAMLPDG